MNRRFVQRLFLFLIGLSGLLLVRNAIAQESGPSSRPSIVDSDWKLAIKLPEGFSDLRKDDLAFEADSQATSRPMVRYLFARADGVSAEISVLPWSLARRRAASIFHSLEIVADFVARTTDARIASKVRGWTADRPFIRWVTRRPETPAQKAGVYALQLTASVDDVLMIGLSIPDTVEFTPAEAQAVFNCADRTDRGDPVRFTIFFRNYAFEHPTGWVVEDTPPLLSLRSADRTLKVALGFESLTGRAMSDADLDLAALRAFAGERAAYREAFAIHRPAEATYIDSRYRFSEMAFSVAPLDKTSTETRILRYFPTEGGRIIASAVFPKAEPLTLPPEIKRILDGAVRSSIEPTSRPESLPATSQPTK